MKKFKFLQDYNFTIQDGIHEFHDSERQHGMTSHLATENGPFIVLLFTKAYSFEKSNWTRIDLFCSAVDSLLHG